MRANCRYLMVQARDDRGVAGVVLAIVALALVGMVGLAVDVGNWYAVSRRTQLAADAAAVAAAFEVANGRGTSAAGTAALREARKNGFSSDSACTINSDSATAACRLYSPPRADSGHSDKSTAVQVILTEPTSGFFSSAFVTSPTVKSNSVMQVSVSNSSNSAGYCLLALDTTASDALRVHNNAVVKCGVAANSSINVYDKNEKKSTSAIRIDNNGKVYGNAYAVGAVAIENNGELHGNSYAAATYLGNNAVLDGSQATSSSAVTDPYGTWEAQNSDLNATCLEASRSGKNKDKAFTFDEGASVTLAPGRYCEGWEYQNKQTLTLTAGVYVVEKMLSVGNNAKIIATSGTTIILKGNYALDIGNNASFSIKAPTTGNYSGMALYSYRTNKSCSDGTSAPCSKDKNEIVQRFSNNSVLSVQGAIYAPTQKIMFDNNSNITMTDCAQIVGRKIEVENNGSLSNGCVTTTTGTTEITAPAGTTTIKTLQ